MPKTKPIDAEQLEANMKALPEIAWVEHIMDGSAVAIFRGENGFRPADPDKWPMSQTHPAAFVKQQNEAMGVTPAQARAMSNGSMFGWDKPAAHPDSPLNQREFA